MSTHTQSQRIMPLVDIVNVSLANDINVVYGTATRLVAAAGARMLTVCANKGNGHIALGDPSSIGANNMPAAYNPGAAASDGTSALPRRRCRFVGQRTIEGQSAKPLGAKPLEDRQPR